MLPARRHGRRDVLALAALSFGGAVACSSGSRYIWYTQLPRSEWAQPPQYVIQIGDVLSIRVYEQDSLGGTLKVRSDGRIAVPLIGEVVAAGKHPAGFSYELETAFKRFILTPRVTVNVEQAHPVSVSVLGEVKTGGTLVLEPPPFMLQALAKAGGLTEFADEERIFVVRQVPNFQRIRFTFKAIQDNDGGAAGFVLRNGDVIVVE